MTDALERTDNGALMWPAIRCRGVMGCLTWGTRRRPRPSCLYSTDSASRQCRSATDVVVELTVSDFDVEWRKHHDAVFSDRDIDAGPFRESGWRVLSIGAPACYFDSYAQPLTVEQQQHLAIYESIGSCARQSGAFSAVGFVRNGPHLNPSIFRSATIDAASIYVLRRAALDGFDMHVFSGSESWGLAMLWDEEIAVIGGNPAFESAFVKAAGGEDVLKRNFERFSAYLLTLSEPAAEMVRRLRIQAGR